ncbi:hypothetical protein K7B10_25190 [Streptomyces flavotricini]|uniref:Uncharacterized protein n=1 Tax=Streptomyces flavotricini TaxID=66888 RepID=A0ABS8EAD6_9ACTN|nr:hypothetical protein [Streptomyces flavotricini]MCC0098011.1 hypothetical protein [Streptomyces flavotricini]
MNEAVIEMSVPDGEGRVVTVEASVGKGRTVFTVYGADGSVVRIATATEAAGS